MKLPQAGAHVKIGLVWKGNPCYRDDRTRSPGLSAVLPIVRAAFECLGRDRIAIYALQKEVTRDEAEVLDREGICDLSDELDQGRDAFVDTAAVMSSVDLVISSDTSAAHLAGALDVPVWILVAACPDWRWGTVGASSPWYPSARLFRQSTMGDWSVPVSEASSAIREMIISCEGEHVKRSGIQSSEVDGS